MTDEQIQTIANAIRHISTGGVGFPTGFEALCMSISGHGTPGEHSSVTSSLDGIAEAIHSVAEKLSECASAFDRIADNMEKS